MDVTSISVALDAVVAQKIAEDWLAAWNSRQPERLLAIMTDDVVYDDASWPKQMRGHAAVREFLGSTWRAVPDMSFELAGDALIDPAAPRLAFYWRATATSTGRWDPPGLKPNGKRLAFEGGAFFELRDGKICRAQLVYDVAKILRQAGVLPEPGTLTERISMITANLLTPLRRR